MFLTNLNILSFQRSLRNALSFSAPLTSSVVPTKGLNPTFTRGSTATIEDHEGIIRTVKSGEVRFWGARRVENLYYSFFLTGAATRTDNNNLTYTVGGLTTTNANRINIHTNTSIFTTGDTARSSIYVKADIAGNVGKDIVLRDYSNGGTAGTAHTITLTTDYQRVAIPLKTFDGTNGQEMIWVFGAATNNATGFTYKLPQIEDVTGQTNQNPAEYVSVGVLSSPFHGAMVDGVKYFDTANGNTVVSNVVTEATGAALTTLKGVFTGEYGRTNVLTNSNAFQSWTLTDTTATANNIVAKNGSTEGCLLTEGVAGTALVANSAGTLTAATRYAASAFLQRGNTDWVRLFLDAGANSVSGWFNLNTGAVGTLSAAGTGTASEIYIEDWGSGWYRCVIVGQFSGAIATNVALHSASADASTTRVNNATYYAWGGQCEAGSFASTLIPTTTASVARANEALTYTNPTSNFNAVGSVYAEIALNHSYTNIGDGSWRGRVLNGSVSSATALFVDPVNATAGLWDGAGGTLTVGNNTLQWARGTVYKLASSWSGTTESVSEGGSGNSDANFDGTIHNGDAGIRVGTGGSETTSLFGGVKNLKIYRRAYDTTKLNTLTT